jgi:hypothetical protein
MNMIRRLSWLASAFVAVLALTSNAEAALRHQRLGHPKAPPGKQLPAEVEKVVKKEFPKGKITGWWIEEKGELEVFVSTPRGPVEVVFIRKGKHWRLAGFEKPVPASHLTPKARAKLKAKFPKAKIIEVEEISNASHKFLGFQVLLSGVPKEVFITAAGVIKPDPL